MKFHIPKKYCLDSISADGEQCHFIEELSVGRGYCCAIYGRQIKRNKRFNYLKPKWCIADEVIVKEIIKLTETGGKHVSKMR